MNRRLKVRMNMLRAYETIISDFGLISTLSSRIVISIDRVFYLCAASDGNTREKVRVERAYQRCRPLEPGTNNYGARDKNEFHTRPLSQKIVIGE